MNVEEVFIKDLIDNQVMDHFGNGVAEVKQNSILLAQIQDVMNRLLSKYQSYNTVLADAKQAQIVVSSQEKLNLQKNMIYEDFFKLQDLINQYINQKIIMTYVHVDELTGKREIRIFENNLANVSISGFTRFEGDNTHYKLAYEVQNHYQKLRNSLPDEENAGLQEAATQVEKRYVKYKKRILWRDPSNGEWIGYKLVNRGPINEAFVNFYVHEIQLNNSLNENIHSFMLDPKYGAINADNANGFLMGDVSLGRVQFGVKGKYGSVQNFTDVIQNLQQLQKNFSHSGILEFKKRFINQELAKSKQQITKLEMDQMKGLIRYYKDKLLEQLT